jgi:hypothetical protein
MADSPFIRQCYSVTGDWFVVDNTEDRWFIERVVLWSVVEVEGAISQVRAIESSGLPGETRHDPFFA